MNEDNISLEQFKTIYKIIQKVESETNILLTNYLDYYGHVMGAEWFGKIYGESPIYEEISVSIKFIDQHNKELKEYISKNIEKQNPKFYEKIEEYFKTYNNFKKIVGKDDFSNSGVADSIKFIREYVVSVKENLDYIKIYMQG